MNIHYETTYLDCITFRDESFEKIMNPQNVVKVDTIEKMVELKFDMPVTSNISEVTCEDCLELYALSPKGRA